MPNVVLDASTRVGALLKAGSVPEQALLRARSEATICLSHAVEAEISAVFLRPKFSRHLAPGRIEHLLALLAAGANYFTPDVVVTDCRDPKDNTYLELTLAAQAIAVVSSDQDLLVLGCWRGIAIVTPATFLTQKLAG